MSKNELEFRIITVGDSGVGKTSIIRRYVHSIYDDDSLSTIGVSFSYKEVVRGKDKIKLKLVDTAGQEKFKSLTKSYFKNTDVVLFVFALDDKISFNNIKEWIELFIQNNSRDKEVLKYLVGNKNDLKSEIEQKLIDDFANENQFKYISTSAKDNVSINELFEKIADNLYNAYIIKGDIKQKNIILKNGGQKQPKKNCFLCAGDV